MSPATTEIVQSLAVTIRQHLDDLHHQHIDDLQVMISRFEERMLLTVAEVQHHLDRQDDERRLIWETVQTFGVMYADLTQRVSQLEQTVEQLSEELASVQRQRQMEAGS